MEIWPTLPPSLEAEMAAQEADRRHIPQARAVLERALINQFQAIAEDFWLIVLATESPEGCIESIGHGWRNS